MKTLQARVVDGRLVADDDAGLPEGTVVQIAVVDEPDDLDDEERALLYQELRLSLDEAGEGRTRPAEEILNEIKSRP